MIVGRTLTALLYAWRLQRKCILMEPFLFHPLSDEYLDIDFSEFGVDNAEQLKNNLIFTMGLTSLLIHQDNVASYRPITNVLITKGNTRIELKEEVEVFDGKKVQQNQVFDEFYWRSGQPHENFLLQTQQRFCNRVHFYPSQRSSVSKRVKDFTVASNLSDKMLLKPDYGNGMVRIKTQRIFKSEGLKGEFSWQRGDKKYYKKIKFDFVGRDVLPRLEQKMTFKEVWDMQQKEGRQWKTWKRLTSKEKTWLGSSQ